MPLNFSAVGFADPVEKVLINCIDISNNSRILKVDIACKEKQMTSANISQEFLTYNEIGIDDI